MFIWRGGHCESSEVGDEMRHVRGVSGGNSGGPLRPRPRRSRGLRNRWVRSPFVVLTLAMVATITSSVSSDHSIAANRSSASSTDAGVKDMLGMIMPTPSSYIPDAPALVPEGWTASASSHTPGHAASAALSGEPAAYWQSGPSVALPQSLTIDIRGSQEVSGLTYEPRHGAKPQGAIGRFEVTVSSDGKHFGRPVATGTWQNTARAKTIGFAPVTVRWVRLTALGFVAGSGSDVTASSLTLYGVPQETATLDASTKAVISTNPSIVGQWGATIGFPLVPVAAAMLPDNQLLTWSADADESFANENTANYTQTAILNLNTGVVTQVTVSNTNHNMFCPGVAILPNGEVIVAGGDSDNETSIYNPATDSWSKGSLLNIPRGYNGMTLLSNGQAFTLGGSWSGSIGGKSAEVWSPTAGWRVLPGVPENSILTQDQSTLDDSYGWFVATSGGKVLQAGPSQEMHWITTSGSGTITPAGLRGTSNTAMEGNAVYYDVNKVLTLGGAARFSGSTQTNDPANSQAYVIDLSSGTPQVTQVSSMHYPRTYSNSVVLPNGQVVVVGGQTSGYAFNDSNSVLNPELWDPTTGRFSVLAPEAEPRNYHSVAVLLPSGQIFSGGGGLCGSCATNHADGQIYSPPYLFNSDGTPATQPVITSAPTSATDGQTIAVTTDSPVSSFSMVRYGESTHAADDDQRRIPLSIVSSSGNTYQLAIPSDPGIALPGPYMLFAMNSAGTPSVATTISVSNGPAQTTNNYSQTVLSNGPAIYWPLNETSGPTATDLSGNADTGTYSSTGVTYGASSPVEALGGQGVTLDGASGQIKASQEIFDPGTYSESMWLQTTTASGGYLMSFTSPPVSGSSAFFDHQVWMNDTGQIAIKGPAAGGLSNISTAAYNDGNWHYVVAVANPSQTSLYVDGQLVAKSSSPATQNKLGRWMVGYGTPTTTKFAPSSDYFAGTISDVAFSDFKLSASQIQSQRTASPAG